MLQVPELLGATDVAQLAALIALIVGIVQTVSIVPVPEGSQARAILVLVLSTAFIVLVAIPAPKEPLEQFALSVAMSWAALAGAALGINRAGALTVQVAAERLQSPTVTDYDPKAPGQPQG